MNGKAGNKFKGWRRAMASAALAFAVFPLLAASAGAGVPKSSGTIEVKRRQVPFSHCVIYGL